MAHWLFSLMAKKFANPIHLKRASGNCTKRIWIRIRVVCSVYLLNYSWEWKWKWEWNWKWPSKWELLLKFQWKLCDCCEFESSPLDSSAHRSDSRKIHLNYCSCLFPCSWGNEFHFHIYFNFFITLTSQVSHVWGAGGCGCPLHTSECVGRLTHTVTAINLKSRLWRRRW